MPDDHQSFRPVGQVLIFQISVDMSHFVRSVRFASNGSLRKLKATSEMMRIMDLPPVDYRPLTLKEIVTSKSNAGSWFTNALRSITSFVQPTCTIYI
jgi:hypothetical protein